MWCGMLHDELLEEQEEVVMLCDELPEEGTRRDVGYYMNFQRK